jgi:two-component system cell cycle response regulator
MKEPLKTRRIKTVPIAIADDDVQVAPPVPSQGRASYGPPSSDSSWITETVVVDRTTEPELAVPSAAQKDRVTLTVITGFNAGQVFALDGTTHSIGRGTEADVWVEDAGVSREHALITCRADGAYWVEDLDSTNGTFVAGERIKMRELKSGDRLQLGPSLVLRFAVTDDAEEELQRRLYESSTKDALTRAFNRKYFTERLVAEVAHSRRHRVKLSVLLLDVDEFKKVNDTYGHLVGDMVLRMVSAAIARLIRVEDLLARYGGEEFVILARSTGRSDAAILGERVRQAVAAVEVPLGDGEPPLSVTISVGVSTLADAGPEAGPDELLALADKRMYMAKEQGRNRVISES